MNSRHNSTSGEGLQATLPPNEASGEAPSAPISAQVFPTEREMEAAEALMLLSQEPRVRGTNGYGDPRPDGQGQSGMAPVEPHPTPPSQNPPAYPRTGPLLHPAGVRQSTGSLARRNRTSRGNSHQSTPLHLSMAYRPNSSPIPQPPAYQSPYSSAPPAQPPAQTEAPRTSYQSLYPPLQPSAARTFSTTKERINHLAHSDCRLRRRWRCPRCDVTIIGSKKKYKDHVEEAHYDFKCSCCLRAYKTSLLRDIHWRNHHMVGRCHVCGSSFSDQDEFDSHMLTHGIENGQASGTGKSREDPKAKDMPDIDPDETEDEDMED